MGSSPDGMSSAATRGRELIAFRIGAQEFCVDIMTVREIRGWTPATTLPHTPPFVTGVINLRGAVLPIIDLACRLGFPASVPNPRHVIIVAQVAKQTIGLLVDAVSDILTIDDDGIQATPDLAPTNQIKAFVRGLLPIEGRMISLLSLDRVLPTSAVEAA